MQNSNTYQRERPRSNGVEVSRVEARSVSSNANVSRVKAAKALFVLAAGASFLFSVYLWFLVDREQGMFVGLWVPSILALGALLLSGKGARQ